MCLEVDVPVGTENQTKRTVRVPLENRVHGLSGRGVEVLTLVWCAGSLLYVVTDQLKPADTFARACRADSAIRESAVADGDRHRFVFSDGR